MMRAAQPLAPTVGVAPAGRALHLPRASFYRHRSPPTTSAFQRPTPARALGSAERQRVLNQLHAGRFVGQSPREIYATLLDQGYYLCSIRSMYRLLEQQGELRERRDQLAHPTHPMPQLVATEPQPSLELSSDATWSAGW